MNDTPILPQSRGTTHQQLHQMHLEAEEEAMENIKDAIKTYLESIEDLKRLKKLRTVEVSV